MASLECSIKPLVELNQSNGISRLLLNDPTKRNALSKGMLSCLIKALNKIKDDERQKIVVIRGAEGVFSSGADLQWMQKGLSQTHEQNLADANLFYEAFELLNNFPKPVIIWVEKYAMGGALGLLATADYVVADKDARMAFSEVKLGLVPATIAPFVINKIGNSHARALMLSAASFTAKKARQVGLVHETMASKDIPARIDELCEAFKGNGPQAMATTKQLINQMGQASLSQNKATCTSAIAEARSSAEGVEGVKAFFEKRLPEWNK
ncbi:enoyl-CoA hydratase/isomerase family protein [Carboxylicivirga mesophila]|uniref:Enoyl-CoA hydratase/isomerase family protein n=1 Tax=Carboxylicivirga mesophila TaxID=1166478 RepID=A0ABS5KA26_9BACT|nr:enoyl-CoA hydratase-related protein [Carboxylicivirga mesophila]MBS2211825.1 enoyl-CoA hydratase/isomerase family protein [Carboxylicivirga mesophila]